MKLARLSSLLGALALLASLLAPSAALAAEPQFGQPSATAVLGDPLTFTSHIDGVGGGSVEVVAGLVGKDVHIVLPAHPGTVAGDWQVSDMVDIASAIECACHASGSSTPNTHIEYQFRVRNADGTLALGPMAEVTAEDTRFQWQTLDDALVHVHWYQGDQAFAQAAADVANTAIDHAAQLMGSTLPAPVDLYVYATQEALLGAVSPSRENIAGEAHPTISTMYVWLPPDQDPARSKVIVAHELTHLVFNEATHNLYHLPPRWLNEGIAVYLSEGYGLGDQATVSSAAADGSLIPLQGLAGLFPSPRDEFYLAYAESVASVDFFIKTYTEQKLWDLVRSYSQGLSDDDAFTAATGGDAAAFNAAWMASLGAQVREPVGPQPAPPGPVPVGWVVAGQPSAAPGRTLAPGETAVPGKTPVPNPAPGSGGGGSSLLLIGLVLGIIVVVGLVIVVLIIQRGGRRSAPPPPPPPPTWWSGPQ